MLVFWSRRVSRSLIWVGYAAFLLFQITLELVVFIVVYWDRRWSVRLVFSAWDQADIVSDPAGGLTLLTIIVQKIKLQLSFVKTFDQFVVSAQNWCCRILLRLLLHHILWYLKEFFFLRSVSFNQQRQGSKTLSLLNGLKNGSEANFDVKKFESKVWMLMIINFSCSKDQRRNFSQKLIS